LEVSAFEPFASSASVRCPNHSVTRTRAPSAVTATDRGWASAGRAVTEPRRPVAASVALRSTVSVTVMVAVSITDTVPSTQLATKSLVLSGESARPVGSEPTETSRASTGSDSSDSISTTF
jgi:hypothetical protein